MIVDFKPAAEGEGSQSGSAYEESRTTSNYSLGVSSTTQSSGSRGKSVQQAQLASSVASPSAQSTQIPEISPPDYEYPASGSHIIAPVVTAYGQPIHQSAYSQPSLPSSYNHPIPAPPTAYVQHHAIPMSPVVSHENEWETALRHLDRNLSDLHATRASHGHRTYSYTARLLHILFSSTSFIGAKSSLGRDIDLEWQENSIRLHAQEELVLMGMRKLASVHPNVTDRKSWRIKADDFEESMRSKEKLRTTWTNFPIVVMAEKIGVLGKKEESSVECLLKGVLIISILPFACIYFNFYIIGAIMIGIQKLLMGIFHVLTFGHFK